MNFKLPPLDPFESLGMAPPDDYRMEAPAAFYVDGAPTPAAKQLANAFLDHRPGALIVVASEAARGGRHC
jgi:hypothetical protein